jgi:hypothetical protein
MLLDFALEAFGVGSALAAMGAISGGSFACINICFHTPIVKGQEASM